MNTEIKRPEVKVSSEAERRMILEVRECRYLLMTLSEEASLTKRQRRELEIIIKRLWEAMQPYGAPMFWEYD